MSTMKKRKTEAKSILLSDLNVGDKAVIITVKAEKNIRKRLLEMGITKGEEVIIDSIAPLGDPMELVIRGYHLSLRREEAKCIEVKKVDTA